MVMRTTSIGHVENQIKPKSELSVVTSMLVYRSRIYWLDWLKAIEVAMLLIRTHRVERLKKVVIDWTLVIPVLRKALCCMHIVVQSLMYRPTMIAVCIEL